MRRWIWVSGSVAFLLAVGLAFLVFLPHRAPYRFLEGFQRFDVLSPGARRWRDLGIEMEVASFARKDAFDRVERKAKAELLPLGFQLIPLNGEVRVCVFRSDAPSPKGAPVGFICLIEGVYPDLKGDADLFGYVPGRMRPGWVTVIVLGPQPQGLLDRFRPWLGL